MTTAEEVEAHDRLIEAAPDLLEALKGLMARMDEHFGGDPSQDWKEQADARAALAKAGKLDQGGSS